MANEGRLERQHVGAGCPLGEGADRHTRGGAGSWWWVRAVVEAVDAIAGIAVLLVGVDWCAERARAAGRSSGRHDDDDHHRRGQGRDNGDHNEPATETSHLCVSAVPVGNEGSDSSAGANRHLRPSDQARERKRYWWRRMRASSASRSNGGSGPTWIVTSTRDGGAVAGGA